MSIVRRNLAANFAGNAWAALIGLIQIPLYIHFLGIEAWGLIGVFASLQGISLLMDFGLSTTLNREMARLSVREDKSQQMRDLLRTLEVIYWALAVAIGISIFALAPVIANDWVQAGHLSPETITQAIRIMASAISLQCVFSLYSGGLLGLQRQVLLSAINVSIATLRGVGSVLVLWKISPTVEAFCLWQLVVSIVQICMVAWFLWRRLPRTQTNARFQLELLRATWRFAAGISGIAVLTGILTQMDKVILSRLLSLESFGYYVLAGTVATGVYLLVLPIFSAIYPRFTQLVSLGDVDGLKQLYHHSCQLISVLILPVSIVIAFFSKDVLFFWTGNSTTVANTHLVLSIVVLGTALNGLIYLPVALQLSYGWTKLAFCINAVAALILAPSIILMAYLYGAVGAALVWVTVNGGAVIIGVHLMHRRLLKGEQWRWYFEDVGLPLIVSLGAAFVCSLVAPTGGPRFQSLIVLAGVTILVTGTTFLSTPVTRLALFGFFGSRRARVFKVS